MYSLEVSRRLAPQILILAGFLGGCERPPQPSPAHSTPLGPRQTLQRLRELRAQRKYTELRTLVVPHAAGELATTLIAVDAFLDANRRLCDWIRDHAGIGLAPMIDQSYLADALGFFSRHVEFLDESIIGDRASVAFTVAGRLPTRQARLCRREGRWHYDPEGGYSEHLPAAFREMAQGLEELLADFQAGRSRLDQFRERPEELVEKVRLRLRRGADLLSRARTAAEAGGG